MTTWMIPPKMFRRRAGWAGNSLGLVQDPTIKSEGYRITASAGGIEIASSDESGAFYARQTLAELARLHNGRIPACRIEDHPDFSRRGVYLDCARGKVPTVATLKALVDRLAAWKINEFQIYIKNAFTWARHPEIGQGYNAYTPDDMRAVDAYCRARHIRFVPSLASFSHMELTLALPRYRHLAELPGAMGWPGGTLACMTDPATVTLLSELYAEFLPAFSATDVNVCCDEPWELGQGRSRPLVEKMGKGQVYMQALLALQRICERHGKRMNAWGDLVLQHPEVLPGMPKDMVMLNWDYEPDGKLIPRTREFAEAGIPVMVCPGTGAWQSHGTRLVKAIGNVAHFAAAGRRYNALGMLNTDWGDLGHRNPLGVSLHSYAHGAAHAWNGAAVNDKTFTRAFTFHVFNDRDGRLAEAIWKLGETDTESRLYHALVEPLELPVTRYINRFDPPSIVSHYPALFPEAISKSTMPIPVIRWPRTDAGLPEFERLAIEECKLAERMNALAIRRSAIGRAVRSGARIQAGECRDWADEMELLAQDFATLWRCRNRPTRLKDNLKMMAFAAEECRSVARGGRVGGR